jgi:CheY-like chemotaxis protein
MDLEHTMSTLPRALVIEDHTTHAVIAEVLLGERGFAVEVVSSLWEGLQRAQRLLDRTREPVPLLILLDLKLPDPRVPSLEGSMLAAQLTEGMETGLLHPAHIVAITSEPTEQRAQEALLAGCSRVLTKPLTHEQATVLRALVDTPPAIPVAPIDPAYQLARQLLRRAATQVLEALQAGSGRSMLPLPTSAGASPEPLWDEEHVRQLIFTPTTLLRAEPWQSWLRARGGLEMVRARIAAMPLPEDQQRMLAELLRSAPTWQSYTARFHIGRMTYYRHLKKLLIELVSALNEW